MFNTTTLFMLSLPAMLNNRGADVAVPFTHDFDSGLNGWSFAQSYWSYTGQSNTPDFTHVPNFNNDGNYVWTQRSIISFNSVMSFRSDPITGVSESTKFYFRYWFSKQNAEGLQQSGIFFYVIDTSSEDSFPPIVTVSDSSDGWRDAMIDCQNHTCCLGTPPCEVQLLVMGTVGGPDGDAMGLAAIRCVSTEEHGCDYQPTLAPTTNDDPTTATPPPGGSPFGSTPNLLAIVLFALLSLTLF